MNTALRLSRGVLAIGVALGWACQLPAIGPVSTREKIEADWLRQDEVRRAVRVTPEENALGGCDGIKNGRWGFHTGLEENPWWQLDLGQRAVHFSPAQEQELAKLRQQLAGLLE